MTQAAAAPLPGVTLFAGVPVAQDVEWFASAERLCNLIADVAALPETQLNPGVATLSDFAEVSFKGGSEGGVVSLTTQVTTKAGRNLCICATRKMPGQSTKGDFWPCIPGCSGSCVNHIKKKGTRKGSLL
ncbi:hypothetical protein ACFFLM_25745 [Deinococcus oregonensis]|uniref:Uncharacterized protein n=1 Tax=Deinococcus oregonensis TaxID=1805970 RepID=A0ABV6B6F5_9DEIO